MEWYAVRMWQGGSIIGNSFGGGGESCCIIARQGTIIVAWNTFQAFRGFVLDTRNAPQAADLSFRNNTIYSTYETALLLRPDSEAEVVNCIFDDADDLVCFGGSASLRYNDFWPFTDNSQCVLGVGHISADPQYCTAPPEAMAPWITLNSPCAGAGEGGLNIGAGGTCGVISVPSDDSESPSANIRLAIIPNPVRARTEFRVSGATEPTALEIYDSAGRVVDIIQPGRAPYVWEPSSSVRPGVYFVRLRAHEGSATSKFVVLPR